MSIMVQSAIAVRGMMMKRVQKFLCAGSLGFLLVAAPALAQDEPDCTSPQTQANMNTCADADFLKADGELNALWEDAKTNSENSDDTGAQAKALLTAQRSWLVFRDSQCEMEGIVAAGGSIQPMLIANCKTRMTTERVKQLQDYINGPE
jgi:uncharacterized protein YecT (DUF1311 family)